MRARVVAIDCHPAHLLFGDMVSEHPEERAMSSEIVDNNRPHTGHLHPVVYLAMVGLALWLIVSVWGFAADGQTDYLLVVVSGFFIIAVVLPSLLWLVWRKNQTAESVREGEAHGSFRTWAAGDFDTWQGRLKGREAAIQILLPIAVVSFGMTAFAIVLHLVEHHLV
jgi:hypothetical protein